MERYIQRPRDGRKAEVESYIRKAKMYYGNNPKVQCLVKETEESIKETIANGKKVIRNTFIVLACLINVLEIFFDIEFVFCSIAVNFVFILFLKNRG